MAHHLGVSAHLDMAGTKFVLEPRVAALCTGAGFVTLRLVRVYQNGGCMDSTREFARWVHPGTADLVLPLQ